MSESLISETEQLSISEKLCKKTGLTQKQLSYIFLALISGASVSLLYWYYNRSANKPIDSTQIQVLLHKDPQNQKKHKKNHDDNENTQIQILEDVSIVQVNDSRIEQPIESKPLTKKTKSPPKKPDIHPININAINKGHQEKAVSSNREESIQRSISDCGFIQSSLKNKTTTSQQQKSPSKKVTIKSTPKYLEGAIPQYLFADQNQTPKFCENPISEIDEDKHAIERQNFWKSVIKKKPSTQNYAEISQEECMSLDWGESDIMETLDPININTPSKFKRSVRTSIDWVRKIWDYIVKNPASKMFLNFDQQNFEARSYYSVVDNTENFLRKKLIEHIDYNYKLAFITLDSESDLNVHKNFSSAKNLSCHRTEAGFKSILKNMSRTINMETCQTVGCLFGEAKIEINIAAKQNQDFQNLWIDFGGD